MGLPVVVVLALAGETVGVGGLQVLVGVGMGCGVGFMQSRALRGLVAHSARWFWSCAVGLGLPFLVTDIARLVGRALPYSLPVLGAAGGLLVGLWQARLLRAYLRSPVAWTLASGIGWTLAVAAASVSDYVFQARLLQRVVGALIYLGAVGLGGGLLAAVTGFALRLLWRHPNAA